ncbi:MaoC/PaaZ C-terminal domain-containing protein [Paraglaciecola aquimarina]|uniref:MaoC/PaaZ C-terminal domain-containing protein n=1 Tax=Paraglaciecola aquimarina TaxID=1235557 RepID=A0ABU3SWK8_9ALTE|nr:MaoC/PaaZ C-terminal domain-containing protein [Paraglaciecola aquimarina]MDU0354380.1 MaoC/PaaZ C-terminal domain-containing protein [Paraglaciecola aquimarina]
MESTTKQTSELKKVPNIKMLMFKSLFKRASKQSPSTLPRSEFRITNIAGNQQSKKIALFHQVVDWPGEYLHPCYIHSLAFPLHMKLLLTPSFPFPLLGLVHIENKICQYRPIYRTENLTLTCRLADLVAHPKGWLFSVITECTTQGELIWCSESINLYRVKHSFEVASQAKPPAVSFSEHSRSVHWRLASNLGRLYANASGDYNPIHLAKWSARLFGFKRQIIHGMWTKSRSLSELQKQYPAAFDHEFTVQTAFKLPLYLPSNVVMLSQPFVTTPAVPEIKDRVKASNTIAFKVETQLNDSEVSPHLLGSFSFT